MKTLKYNTGTMLLTLLFVVGFTMTMQAQHAEKVIAKDYTISEGFTLGIDNQYGEINLVNWDQDECSVVVTVRAEAGSQSAADDLLKNVDIDISESDSRVEFETDISSNAMSGRKKINVSYEVKVPAYINVSLEQSYGHIYIQEIAGVAELDVRYGSLTADALSLSDSREWNSLDLAYGEADIAFVSALLVDMKYSNATLSESQMLEINSAYSKVFMDQVGELKIDSKYDKYTAAYLEESLNISSAYTQLTVDMISKNFTEINARMKYGNFKGGLENNTAFKIDAEVSYGSINIPEGNYELIRENTSEEAHGIVGSNPVASVSVSLRYGNFNLN